MKNTVIKKGTIAVSAIGSLFLLKFAIDKAVELFHHKPHHKLVQKAPPPPPPPQFRTLISFSGSPYENLTYYQEYLYGIESSLCNSTNEYACTTNSLYINRLYEYNLITHSYTILHQFNSIPQAITVDTNGNIYGININPNELYEFNTNTNSYKIIHSFSNLTPVAITVYNNTIYGLGISNTAVSLFIINPQNPKTYTKISETAVLGNFSNSSYRATPDIIAPTENMVYVVFPSTNTNSNTNASNTVSPTNCGGILGVYNLSNNSFSILHQFGSTSYDGQNPISLIYYNHTLYGTTRYGGKYQDGTIFKYDISNSQYQILSNLVAPNGVIIAPNNIVRLGTQLYGTSLLEEDNQGNYHAGAIFEYNLATNSLTVAHVFAGNSISSLGIPVFITRCQKAICGIANPMKAVNYALLKNITDNSGPIDLGYNAGIFEYKP